MTSSVKEILPLSPLQKGLLFHGLYDSTEHDPYAVQLLLEIEGCFQPERLRQAIDKLLERHSNLRACFVYEGLDEPLQIVPAQVRIPWSIVELEDRNPEAKDQEIAAILAADLKAKIDLRSPPLMRFTVIRAERNRTLLVFTHHHVLLDGWSASLFIEELFQLYSSRDGEQIHSAPAYKDYLAWIHQQNAKTALSRRKAVLQDLEEPCLLAPQSRRDTRRDTVELSADKELTGRLASFARDNGLTLNTLICGAWAVLLSRLTRRNDVVFGTTFSTRPPEVDGVERMIGLLINTLPIRVCLRPNEPSISTLRKIQSEQIELVSQGYIGLSDLHSELGVNELFDSLVVFENYPSKEDVLAKIPDGLIVRAAGHAGGDVSHYPLSILAGLSRGRLLLKFGFDSSIFSKAEVSQYIESMLNLLRWFAAHPNTSCLAAPLATLTKGSSGYEAPLLDGNSSNSIDQLFDRRVNMFPHFVAVIQDGQSVTYKELKETVDRLAVKLTYAGVGPQDFVGICGRSSPNLIASFLAVLRVRAIIVPLDPEHPSERLNTILKRTSATVLLASSELADRLSAFSGKIVSVEEQAAPYGPTRNVNPAPANALDIAYCIYTSGSAGEPKGVMVTHGNLAAQLPYWASLYGVKPGEAVLQFASFGFDAGLGDILAGLLGGATLVLRGNADSVDALQDLARRHGVTSAFLPPALLRELDPKQMTALRRVITGGEACTEDILVRWMPHVEIINGYGPTETTICVSHHSFKDRESDPSNIGQPSKHCTFFLLDQGLNVVPDGMVGELYISGACVARGYVNQASMTAERFVANPFATDGSRMYRTGDLARKTASGDIQFLGRVDTQVKIRGLRIELGEIEAALLASGGVRNAAVTAQETTSGDKCLIGYVVPHDNLSVSNESLRARLEAVLPRYMIPDRFITLNALPLTPNGKIDRKSLPRADLVSNHGVTGPRNATESQLVAIWSALLGTTRIGVDDNFFSIGGNSLSAIRMISRVKKEMGVSPSLKQVFATPTIRGLAEVIANLNEETALQHLPSNHLGNSAKNLASFVQEWILDWERKWPGNTYYNMPYAWRIKGPLSAQRLETALAQIIDRHSILRTSFSEDGAVPRTKIAKHRVGLAIDDLSALDYEAAQKQAIHCAIAEGREPFDLSKGGLFRSKLLRLRDDEHVLLTTYHHTAADGWSIDVFMKELGALYEGKQIPPPVAQYADFAQWQRSEQQLQVAENHLEFWKKELMGARSSCVPIRWDLPHPQLNLEPKQAASLESTLVTFTCDSGLLAKLGKHALVYRSTKASYLLAAFFCVVRSVCKNRGLVVRYPVVFRPDPAFDELIGCFLHHAVVRTDFEQKNFADLALTVAERVREGMAHAGCQLRELSRLLTDTDAYPLRFNYTGNLGQTSAELGAGLSITQFDAPHIPYNREELTLSVAESASGLICTLEFRLATFGLENACAIASAYERLLHWLAAKSAESLTGTQLPTDWRSLNAMLA